MKTLQQAAQTAIDVQDACNLSGVVRDFSDILLNTLWPEARRLQKGTDWVNQHPIAVMFASKIESLTRLDYDTFSEAYDSVQALAKGTSDG